MSGRGMMEDSCGGTFLPLTIRHVTSCGKNYATSHGPNITLYLDIKSCLKGKKIIIISKLLKIGHSNSNWGIFATKHTLRNYFISKHLFKTI